MFSSLTTLMQSSETDYSPATHGGGSDLASTLSILHAIEPCGRSLRLLGRWALPLIHIRGSETDVSSFAHWRVPKWEDVFSRTTRARIRTLVGMTATYESGVPSGKLFVV
jgi:hypothetical protein